MMDDGITDIAFRQLDTDGDGVADTVGIDYDRNGNFDDFQSTMRLNNVDV